MKLVYPARPVADLYLSGFVLSEIHFAGSVSYTQLTPGWNLRDERELTSKGVIARIAVKMRTVGWTVADFLGWRVDAIVNGVPGYCLAGGFWRYGETPTVWEWDMYPRLPFSGQTSLGLYVYYDTGDGTYAWTVRYLLQDYS